MQPYDAVVLAGGRARRAGGAKLDLVRDGLTLLSGAVTAVAGAQLVVVVGPPVPLPGVDRPVLWCREDPPFAGPVLALTAALPHLAAEVVVLLAGDLPSAGPAVPALLAALTREPEADVAAVVDAAGVAQPLLAAYRSPWLRSRATAGHPAARSLLDGARLTEVADEWGAAHDVDTREDAERLGFRSGPPRPP